MQYTWDKSLKQSLLNAQMNQLQQQCYLFFVPLFLCAVAGKSGQCRVTPGSLSSSWFTAERKTGLWGLKKAGMMTEDWNAAKWAKGTREDKEKRQSSSGMEGSDCRSNIPNW